MIVPLLSESGGTHANYLTMVDELMLLSNSHDGSCA
jgi:hypothetical protein